jgi:hypothetical protein
MLQSVLDERLDHLAEVDGGPVGIGRSIYSDHGVFLIAAPSSSRPAAAASTADDAARRGAPTLVTEAMPDTSHPVLTRLGFTEVCTIRPLEDERDRDAR